MKEIILIGGGGHCISCIDTIEETGLYTIKGVLDLPNMVGKKILNYPFIGTDDDILKYNNENTDFCITVGQLEAGETVRKSVFLRALTLGVSFPVIISPHCYVSKYAVIGEGSIVLSGGNINAKAQIGKNCIINSGSIIEHGAVIGNNCHLSTASVINGDCSIGDNCFIASGVVIRNGISIADNILIGMGSVVTRDIVEPGIYYGNPLRKVN